MRGGGVPRAAPPGRFAGGFSNPQKGAVSGRGWRGRSIGPLVRDKKRGGRGGGGNTKPHCFFQRAGGRPQKTGRGGFRPRHGGVKWHRGEPKKNLSKGRVRGAFPGGGGLLRGLFFFPGIGEQHKKKNKPKQQKPAQKPGKNFGFGDLRKNPRGNLMCREKQKFFFPRSAKKKKKKPVRGVSDKRKGGKKSCFRVRGSGGKKKTKKKKNTKKKPTPTPVAGGHAGGQGPHLTSRGNFVRGFWGGAQCQKNMAQKGGPCFTCRAKNLPHQKKSQQHKKKPPRAPWLGVKKKKKKKKSRPFAGEKGANRAGPKKTQRRWCFRAPGPPSPKKGGGCKLSFAGPVCSGGGGGRVGFWGTNNKGIVPPGAGGFLRGQPWGGHGGPKTTGPGFKRGGGSFPKTTRSWRGVRAGAAKGGFSGGCGADSCPGGPAAADFGPHAGGGRGWGGGNGTARHTPFPFVHWGGRGGGGKTIFGGGVPGERWGGGTPTRQAGGGGNPISGPVRPRGPLRAVGGVRGPEFH